MGVTFLIWFIIYINFNMLDQKIRLVEQKNNLFNKILEARRYEKNFFLRQNKENLEKAILYAKEALLMQKEIMDKFSDYRKSEAIEDRVKDIESYKELMEELLTKFDQNKQNDEQWKSIIISGQTQTTELGRRITLEIEKMEAVEKAKLYKLLAQSEEYLIVYLIIFFLISIITSFLLVTNVNSPLKKIEQGIDKISKGDYSEIPTINTNDEFDSLVRNLNNMITELNKRNKQLIQAEKMSSLGVLTSGVAHELNNPLNNISTSLQIIFEEIENESKIDFKKALLEKAEQQIERAKNIVKSLLEFSRQSEFKPSRKNIKHIVEKVVFLIQGDIPSNVDLKVDVPENVFGFIDSNRLQQMLINLSINSFHAMEKKGGSLTISAFENEEKTHIVLVVEDTGSGIKKEILNKIFDPFFTTKETGRGSGLGLSIVHGIVEQHKGHIDIKTKEGEGTKFIITLPI